MRSSISSPSREKRACALAGWLALTLGLAAFACGPGAATPPPPAATTAAPTLGQPTASALPANGTVRGHRFAVAAESHAAAEAAMAVLRAGGSAADAAVAGVLATGVVQPVSSGLGGGGFALYWSQAEGRATVLDFREVAPRELRPEELDDRPAADGHRGVMVGVPGEVAGLAELHRRFGKLAFGALVRGALGLARDGFHVSAHLARTLDMSEAWVKTTPRYAAVFAPLGTLLGAEAATKNEPLARTLERIGAEGPPAFYTGEVARDIVDTAHAAGSRMTLDDLGAYRVVEREPLHARWGGHDVYTMPPPSAGGLMLLETLAMHARASLEKLGYDSGDYQHVLAETFRGAIADRMRFVGDPAFVTVDVPKLSDAARMQARRAAIALDRTREADAIAIAESGTSHLVTVDGEGNVATITSTVNNMFGAKLVTASGFVLNDELDDFAAPAVEKRFGRPGVNAPRPGARPVSSMTPTVVVSGGRAILALGGSGGTRIATGVTQALLARLAFGRSAAEAVSDRRIETPPQGGLLLDEGTDPARIADLERRGEKPSVRPNFSAIQLVTLSERDGERELGAAGDPRKMGAGLVE